jgi:phospholipid transport system substrate-binding protein
MKFSNRLMGLFAGIVFMAATATVAATGPLDQARATVDAVMAILQESDLDKQVRRERLSNTIRVRFDFTEMSQRILALHWKNTGAQQRERFITLFTELLERNYIGRIEAYSGEKIDFVKERVQGNRAAVDTLVATESADIPISYRMVQRGDQWKVYDVVIENVSFVNNYRSSYGEILDKEGFDGLLSRMAEKLAELEQNGPNGKPTEP